MHRRIATITGLTAFIFLALLLATTVNAQNIGCCCDPVVKNGSLSPQQQCTPGFTFIGPPPNIAITCNQHCADTLAQQAAACGDGQCQAPETAASCPQDCGQIVAGCGSPNYRPTPVFTITPVTSKKALKLSYDTACPTDYLTVNRCEGNGCDDFETITQLPPGNEFIDQDPTLKFNQDYTYQLIAHYPLSGNSEPAIAIGNAGDIECWNQGTNNFCISNSYYDQYQTYLKTYGYGQYGGPDFTTNYGFIVNQTFATRINNAYRCNANNNLLDTTPQVSCNLNNDEYCVADEQGPRCVTKEDCNVGFDPFGLYSTAQNCETNRYCFYDKSQTVVNTCYDCKPSMTCNDYKTKGACERDNCGTGDCQWNPVFDDLGIGVCVDNEKSNCAFCTKPANTVNINAFSAIWDTCREEKSDALSTILNPCFYDKDRRISKSCEEVSCADYSRQQCGSPANGITLNPDNSIATPSSDTCGIEVCQYNENTGCIKNADGNTGAGFQDCRYGDTACEQDHYPPTTTLIPTGIAGKIDTINIRVFDKLNHSTPPLDYAGEDDYTTYLCVKTAGNPCNDARTFTIQTTSTSLTLKNGELKDDQTTLTTLAVGNNTIVYYSRDQHNNVEQIKETTIYACDACNGPKLRNITISNGKLHDGTLYTSTTKPTITASFDEPVQITFAEIEQAGQGVSLSQLTQGNLITHEFTTSETLDGTYTLTLNARNDKNIHFTPPGIQYALVVDPNLAGVTISPSSGAIINTSLVEIELNFTQPVTLDNISLLYVDYKNPYAKIQQPIEITNKFETTDNQQFTASIDKLKGGHYTIAVDAKGFNNLDVYRESTFHLATKEPGILLVEPSWGTTAYSVFNTTIETQFPADCKYVWDAPSPPSQEDFQFFTSFTRDANKHTSERFTIPFGAQRGYLLHAYCDFNNFGVIQRTFNITLDPEPPIILNAFAEPATIAEQYIPGENIFVSTLKASLNKEGFCKYSLVTSGYDAMTGTFPGLNLKPKTSHAKSINVSEERPYSYFITCKGKNELSSAPARVPLNVDLDLPLSIKSSTPQGFSTTTFTLGIVASKRVICYFGEQPDSANTCMGDCRAGYTQGQQVTVGGTGQYNYYVKCVHPGGEQTGPLEIPVIIDTTPPEMNYVDDSSSLPEDAEITWHHNKIRVALNGNDAESGIDHYLVTLQGQTDRQIVFKDYIANRTDGEPFYIQTTNNGSPFRLVNNKRYNFVATAVNNVGLKSQPMESDGVSVDISQAPEPCYDGEQNNNETDVDCGGACDACTVGKTCQLNSDCETNYCNDDGFCAETSCEDGILNGVETDVDCGGTYCDVCPNDYSCVINSDCASNYCDINNLCIDAPACADGQLSPGEADIDCGSICDTKCGQDKNCEATADCKSGLRCDPETNTCTSQAIGDADNDGVTDDVDDCPNTPAQDNVDQNGCGPSQQYSLGDTISDGWRQNYFGCISCPEAAADADPDNDGLTNNQEHNQQTNPTDEDTDGDGWNDGTEVSKGTSPTNPADHPPSLIKGTLLVLLFLILLGGAGYGGYLYYQRQQEQQPTKAEPAKSTPPHRPSRHVPTKQEELNKLKQFAKQQELPEDDWIDLAKEIKKKPLPETKFEKALKNLKEIAGKDRPPEIHKLHKTLDHLSKHERQELLSKYKQLLAGKLGKEEREQLFKKLKITSDYYKKHKQELKKELNNYGKQ